MQDLPFVIDVRFDERERELGRRFVAERKVDLESAGEDGVWEAAIQHLKRRIWVQVRVRDGRAEHACDCPFFEDTGTGCEHLFALLATIRGEGDHGLEEVSAEEERAPTPRAPSPRSLQPIWLIDAASSEKEGALFVHVLDPEGRALPLDGSAWGRIDGEADLDAFRAIGSAVGGVKPARLGGGLHAPHGPFRLEGEASGRFLVAAAGTGRLRVAERGRVGKVAGLGAATELVLLPKPAPGGVAMHGELRVEGGDAIDVASTGFALPATPAFALIGERLHAVRHHDAGGWLRTLRRTTAPTMPAARWQGFLEDMDRAAPLPRVALDAAGEPLPIARSEPRPHLELTRPGGRWTASIRVRYGEATVRPSRRGDLVLDLENRLQMLRDREREARWIERLIAAGGENDPEELDGFWLDAETVPSLAPRLLDEGWSVALDERAMKRGALRPFTMKTTRSGLLLSGGAEIGGEPVPLGTLLRGLGAGGAFVDLGEDGLLALEPADRARLEGAGALIEIGSEHSAGLMLTPVQALLAEAYLNEAPKRDAGARAAADRLEAHDRIVEVEPPTALTATLRPYQRHGLSWIGFLDDVGLGGLLADDMGLGKTVQVLAGLLLRAERGVVGPHLAVVPRSLLHNWKAEAERFAPSLEVVLHDGPQRRVGGWSDGALVITTYGILLRDVEQLAKISFDTVVMDEAQAIKNPGSQTAAAARALHGRLRLALTGTPIENDLRELWSLISFAMPGVLGSERSFRARFTADDPASLARLRRAILPILLRRTKKEAAPDLPDLIEQTLLCDMTEEQQSLYGEVAASVRARIGTRSGAGSTVEVLEALLRLRQIACDPALVGPAGEGRGSGKLDMLFERLDELRATGKKALVFSQFTQLLGRVRERLAARGREALWLDGATRDRETPIRRFQEEADQDLFLISLRAGGTGLNLTAADHVFILDPWWNPAVEAQAIARAHRIGRGEPVMAQRLVTRGTVEEGIVELQERKRELADAVVGGEAGALQAPDLDDLRALLAR